MKVDLVKAQKPIRKLRKLIRNFPANPSPSDVHSLRTQARRVEATVEALSPEPGKDARRLLKTIKPLRKAAGGVRDFDVLLGMALTLAAGSGADASLRRLTDAMDGQRKRNAEHLHSVLARRRKKAVELLKEYGEEMEEAAPPIESPDIDAARRLAAELEHWPRLDADNLHEFRIHAKKLGYVLQLAPGVDKGRVEAFRRVKDTAGEWHDWVELSKLAATVLDPAADRAVLDRIDSITREKLRAALACANSLRQLGLGMHEASTEGDESSRRDPVQSGSENPASRPHGQNVVAARKPPVPETGYPSVTSRRARG
jgi:CHAD domain-containing protein